MYKRFVLCMTLQLMQLRGLRDTRALSFSKVVVPGYIPDTDTA
jgi:hypothetical protein